MKDQKAKKSVGARMTESLRQFAEALERKVPLAERFTCRVVRLDLRTAPYSPERVKETRKLLSASQAVFARLLGVSVGSVRAWEQGINSPNEMARRFMDEIRRDPAYWLGRLKEAAMPI